MPHVTIRNVEKKEVIANVKELSKKLTEIIGCPEEWITISYIENTLTYIAGENLTDDNVFVEIKLFERPEEVKFEVQKVISDTFKKEGRDIMINYVILTKESYFENGEIV